MQWYSPFLYPFSLLYHGITALRNVMFDKGIKRSVSFGVPTVVVGNLNVGGSGKTPMVEYLIEQFKGKFQTATLSRGYGRKSRGFLMANDLLTSKDIGDEPFQIYSKFKEDIDVFVGEDRVMAIIEMMACKPNIQLIILDDAFQHRYVKGDFNILLTNFQKPFYKDSLLPLGTLRESPNGAKRADLVIVTKTPPDTSAKKKEQITLDINQYTPAKVVFSHVEYGELYPISKKIEKPGKKVILLSGIANDDLLFEEVNKRYEVVGRMRYGDHYEYKSSDFEKIKNIIFENPEVMVVTTEKDAVKLKNQAFRNYMSEIPIFALPIKVKMGKDDHNWLMQEIEKIIEEKSRGSEN
jgi:tetraacyldisaccharide 4'-kinase